MTGGTLTVPVLANTEKVYEKEIALGAPAHSAVDGYPGEEPSRRPVLFRPDQTAPPGLHLM